jgi:acyl-coenzyme A synthetase/AMP-(fatty) acid ligase
MLLAGGSLALVEHFSASRFVEQAIRWEVTLAALFAAPIRMLLAQPRSPRDGQTPLRAASYAQNITPAQWAAWHERFAARLMQIWGMTETMSRRSCIRSTCRRGSWACRSSATTCGSSTSAVTSAARHRGRPSRGEPGEPKGHFRTKRPRRGYATVALHRDQAWMDGRAGSSSSTARRT